MIIKRFLKNIFIVLLGFLIITFLVLFLFLNKLLATKPNGPNVETVEIYQPMPTPGSDLHALEEDAEIRIPASAREIHGMISGARELNTWVRLDLPYAELPAFIQNARCTTALVVTDPRENIPGELNPDWWQPHKATYLEKCTGLHDYLHQRILVDRSASEKLTIYVFSATDNYTRITTLTPKP